ncbi:MAG: Piwi domain-containing protein [Candidatus Asgardarchaeia archaeon]
MKIGRIGTPGLLFGEGKVGLMPNQLASHDFKPYRMPKNSSVDVVVVYPKNYENEARLLKKELKEGSSYSRRLYPGFKKTFNIDFNIREQPFGYLTFDYEEDYNQYVDAIKEARPSPTELVLVVIPKTPKILSNTPYYLVKKHLINKERYSQMVTIDILKDHYRFRMSLFPIAMQIFTKVGGVPYALSAPLGITTPRSLSIMVGVGLSRIKTETGKITQYIGYINVFEAHGIWLFSNFFVRPYKGDEEGKTALTGAFRTLIQDTMRKIIEEEMAKKEIEEVNLIIHYSGKEISVREEVAVIEASKSLSDVLGISVRPTILKIFTNSIYRAFDEQNETYHIATGTYIEIQPTLYLLSTTGYLPESNKVIGIGTPNPLAVSVKDLGPLDVEGLLYSVFAMTRVNYAGLTIITREPATTRYSRKMAYMMGKLGYEDLIERQGYLSKTLWFI